MSLEHKTSQINIHETAFIALLMSRGWMLTCLNSPAGLTEEASPSPSLCHNLTTSLLISTQGCTVMSHRSDQSQTRQQHSFCVKIYRLLNLKTGLRLNKSNQKYWGQWGTLLFQNGKKCLSHQTINTSWIEVCRLSNMWPTVYCIYCWFCPEMWPLQCLFSHHSSLLSYY